MPDYSQGFLTHVQAAAEARNDITSFVRAYLANLNPLFTRLAHFGVNRVDYDLYSHPFRPETVTLNTAISSGATTTLVLVDNTSIMNHDVLKLVDATGAIEYVWVNGDPAANGTDITVVRGVAGTTPLTSVASSSVIYMVGNARLDGEINQTGLTSIGTATKQYNQVFQHPVEVGGIAAATDDMVVPAGIDGPFGLQKTMQLQNQVNDIERSMMIGKAQAPTATVSAKMNGLREIIPAANRVTAPVNGSAYGPGDLIRDTVGLAKRGGGKPNVLLCSTDFAAGFATWGQGLQRIPAGATEMGVAIDTLYAPMLGAMAIWECPLMPSNTACAISTDEVFIRMMIEPYFKERGSLGNREQGDWIACGSIQVMNPQHHAWVEGITGFAAV